MTEVEFHTGVSDPMGFTCRLLRKAARQGVRVQVTALADTLATLDRNLWTFEERDFVPHVRMPGAPGKVAQRTPIWLCTSVLQDGAPRVLLNLGASAPADTANLDRVIEIVSVQADEAALGRERWRSYKALGLSPRHRHESGPAGG